MYAQVEQSINNRCGSTTCPIQRKSLKQAQKANNMSESNLTNFHAPDNGPMQGHLYESSKDTPDATNQISAINKSAEIYGGIANEKVLKIDDLQSKETARTSKKFTDGQTHTMDQAVRNQLIGELSKTMESEDAKITTLGVSAEEAAPLIESYIEDNSAKIVNNKSGIHNDVLKKFDFTWANLVKGKQFTETKIQIGKPIKNEGWTFQNINQNVYMSVLKGKNQVQGLLDLKTKLKEDYIKQKTDAGTITEDHVNAIKLETKTRVEVKTTNDFDKQFKDKIKKAVNANELTDDNNVSLVDPFLYKTEVTYSGNTMEMTFQHSPDWPGYIIKIKDTGQDLDASMVPKDITNPDDIGRSDEYRRDHGDTGNNELTNLLQIDIDKSRGHNAEIADTYAKIAGEGARFVCVREAAANNQLTNNTYFYAEGKGKNEIQNPGIKLKDLWLAWASEFDKGNNISNQQLGAKLLNCDDGNIKLITGTISVTANSQVESSTYKLT